MTPAQQSAVKVCGVATLVTVVVSVVDMSRLASSDQSGSGLSITLGASVFVAAVAFLLANTNRQSIARAISTCAPIVAMGLAFIAIYKAVARTAGPWSPPMELSGPLDFIATVCLIVLLVDLCRTTKNLVAEGRA